MTQQALNCTKYQTTKRILPFMKIHKPYHTGSKSKGYPNIQFLTAYVTVYCKIILIFVLYHYKVCFCQWQYWLIRFQKA